MTPPLLLLALAAVAGSPEAPRVELPPGPAARAWAGVGPETAPAELAPVAREVLSGADWARWAAELAAERDAEDADPARRAALALRARAQGRDEDAWRHLAACGGDPTWVAALLPALLPGVPLELLAQDGARGVVDALPDGVLLSPAPPPPVAGEWRREASLAGLRVGGAVLDLTVTVDYDGVQVDLQHRAGEPARVLVQLPEPREFEIRVAYLDWSRLDEPGPVAVELAPGSEERSVYGRFAARATPWTLELPAELPEGLARGGLVIVHPPDPARRERLAGLDAALAELLGVPCRRVERAHPGPPASAEVQVDLFEAGWEAKLEGLLSQVERFVLPDEGG